MLSIQIKEQGVLLWIAIHMILILLNVSLEFLLVLIEVYQFTIKEQEIQFSQWTLGTTLADSLFMRNC